MQCALDEYTAVASMRRMCTLLYPSSVLPPHRLTAMLQAATDKSAWIEQLKGAKADVEALIKSTHANPILVRLAWHDR